MLHRSLAMAKKTQMIETPLGQLATHLVGQGSKTLFLWPSIFTDHRIYDGIIERLSGACRFVLIDGPGHGQSDGPTTLFDNADCAEALGSILDAYADGPAVVGGTSWGGMVGAELALSKPERIDKLVMMNTPFLLDGAKPGVKSHFVTLGARYMLGSAFYRNGVAGEFFGDGTLDREADYAAHFHQHLADADGRKLSNAIRSVFMNNRPLMPRLKDIIAESLVIGGEADPMYPISVQQRAANELPKGHFVAVPGKHISPVCAPAAVAKALDAFLKR